MRFFRVFTVFAPIAALIATAGSASAATGEQATRAPVADKSSGPVVVLTDAQGVEVAEFTAAAYAKELANPSSQYSISNGTWTQTVYFNRRETNVIAAGGATCAGLLGRIPFVTIGCGVAAGWAGLAVAAGTCVAIVRVRTTSVFYPTYHSQGRCN